MIYSNLSLDVS